MVIKKVFVKIETRNKPVRFESSDGHDDVDRLRAALEKVAETDVHLQSRLQNNLIFFQELQTTKKGKEVLADIEETEPLEEECQLVATFCSKIVQQAEPGVTTTPLVPEGERTLEVSLNGDLDLDNLFEKDSFFLDGGDVIGDVICENNSNNEPNTMIQMSEGNGNELCEPSKRKVSSTDEPTTGCSSTAASDQSKPRSKKRKVSQAKVPKPIINIKWEEPDANTLLLRPCVDKFHQKLTSQYGNQIIKQFGLMECNHPHYDAMGAIIVQKYPELSSGLTRPQAFVAKQLALFVRQRRRNEKNLLLKHGCLPSNEADGTQTPPQQRQRSINTSQALPSLIHAEEIASEPDSGMSSLQVEKMEKATRELREKTQAGIGATTHHVLLFKETYEYRRTWLTKQLPVGSRIPDILKEWPTLGIPEYMFIEQGLVIEKDHTLLEKAMFQCLLELSQFTETNLEAEATEKEQCDFLAELYLKYKPRNAPKGLDPPFIIKKAGKELGSELVTKAEEGARCVLYLDEEKLNTCFLVVDKDVKIKLLNPSPVKAILLLLSAYRVWDKCFPTAYKCVLSIFEEYGLGVPVSDLNDTFRKFKRAWKLWKAEKSKNVEGGNM